MYEYLFLMTVTHFNLIQIISLFPKIFFNKPKIFFPKFETKIQKTILKLMFWCIFKTILLFYLHNWDVNYLREQKMKKTWEFFFSRWLQCDEFRVERHFLIIATKLNEYLKNVNVEGKKGVKKSRGSNNEASLSLCYYTKPMGIKVNHNAWSPGAPGCVHSCRQPKKYRHGMQSVNKMWNKRKQSVNKNVTQHAYFKLQCK